MYLPRHSKLIACAAALAIATAAAAEMTPPKADDLARWTEAYSHIKTMTPKWAVQGASAFKASSDAGVQVFYLDVRTPAEWQKGVIEGATMVSLSELPSEAGILKLPTGKTTIIAVYCKSGHRSALAIPLLHQLGYENAISMKGGFKAWRTAGYPVEGAAD